MAMLLKTNVKNDVRERALAGSNNKNKRDSRGFLVSATKLS